MVPGFLRAAMTPGGVVANPNVLDTLYTYAWFVTFGLSFALYLAFSRFALRRFPSDATREVGAHPDRVAPRGPTLESRAQIGCGEPMPPLLDDCWIAA